MRMKDTIGNLRLVLKVNGVTSFLNILCYYLGSDEHDELVGKKCQGTLGQPGDIIGYIVVITHRILLFTGKFVR